MAPRSFLDDYEPVESRIARFWQENPNGAIHTSLIFNDESSVAVMAQIYRDKDHPPCDASGIAHEVVGSSPVNKTSAWENAETSAIGRALANLGYAAKNARPSKEEMGGTTITDAQRKELAAVATDPERAKKVLNDAGYKSSSAVTQDDFRRVHDLLVKEFAATPE